MREKIFLATFIAFLFSSIAIYAGDPPHNSASDVDCSDCHGQTLLNSQSPFWTDNTDDAAYSALCLRCHTLGNVDPYNATNAPPVKTHESIKCTTCHHNHDQDQIYNGKNNRGYFFLADGTATGVSYDSGSDTTTITYSSLEATDSNSDWADDLSLLTEKTNEGRGTLLIPNTGSRKRWPLFMIVAIDDPDENTIRVKGNVSAASKIAIMYGQLIRRYVKYDPVHSTSRSVILFDKEGIYSLAHNDEAVDVDPPDGTMDDSTPTGICQVCHTNTDHWRNDGTKSENHYSGQYCIRCHPHTGNFLHGGGSGGTGCIECHGHDDGSSYDDDMTAPNDQLDGVSIGAGTSQSHSTHTETDIDDLKGPGIYCDTCHDINNFPYFKSGDDSNGDGFIELSETNVCDTCHSGGGTYDGLDDPVIGAKQIWSEGAYIATNDSTLSSGKEKWCATCHDEVASEINGVTAPNVVGDEDGEYLYGTGWGYYKTGHGLDAGIYPASEGTAANQPCSGCHDLSTAHIDGEHRTYSVSGDNYQAGYRLRLNMDIPRDDVGEPTSDFELCVDCHNYDQFLNASNYTTNFRNSATGNEHARHLSAPATGQFAGGGWWDSDWNGSGDSKINCTACHNVHGSPSARMIRHGELISTPGTTDKVPSVNFKYTPFTPDYNPTLALSDGGKLDDPGPWGGGTVANSGICTMCHANNISYTRNPSDVPPTIYGAFGNTGSNQVLVFFSEGVYSDSSATLPLTAADFALTDTDDGRTINGVTHTAGATSATLTLSSALDSSDDLGTDTLAALNDSSIYDSGSNSMIPVPVTIEGDGAGPTISTQDPADTATDISIDSNITFKLLDSGSGVDWSTISIQVAGDKGYSKNYNETHTSEVSKTGVPAAYAVTIDPDTNFASGEVITVTVNVDDRLGNSMTPAVWSFTTLGGGGPFSTVLHPSGVADNSDSYAVSSSDWPLVLDNNDGDASYVYRCCGPGGMQFYVDMDDPTGFGTASIQSIQFFAYARYVTGSAPASPPQVGTVAIGYKTGTATVWSSDFVTDGSADYNLVSSAVYTTDSDGGPLDLTDINNLQIAVDRKDPNGNVAAQFRVTEVYAVITYGVPEGDDVEPTIDNLNPANSATDIAIDSNLTFTLSDTGGGIDWTTFQIQLSGDKGYSKTYTDTDTGVVSKAGSMASYDVTVNPDADFSTGEVITVTVNVDDRATPTPNSLTPPTWSFTTESVSTQTLHPSGLGELIDDSESDVQAVGGSWADVLDSNDGVTTHAYLMAKWNGGGGAPGPHPAGFKVEMDDVSGMSTFSEVRAHFVFTFDCQGGGPPGTHDKIFISLDTGSGSTEMSQEHQYHPTLPSDPDCDVASYTTISISSTTDPDGGPWDLTDIQALRAGFKIQARTGVGWQTIYATVTEVSIEVDP